MAAPDAAHESRPKRRLARAAAVAVSIAVALLVAEGALRVAAYGAGALSPAGRASIRPLGQSGALEAAPDPELYYALRPNLDTTFKLAPLVTNSAGMRDREYAVAKPPGTFRVAFVGDSFTMGSGVPVEALFHSLLEERWNAAADGRTYECLNFGVGGYDLPHYAAAVRLRARAFDPDLIVVGLTHTDRTPPSFRPEGQVYEPQPPVSVGFRSELFARLGLVDPVDAPRGDGSRRDALAAVRGQELTGWRHFSRLAATGALDDRERLKYLRSTLAEVQRAAGDVPLAVVHLNINASPEGRVVAGEYRRVAEGLGLPFCDTTPAFKGTDPGDFQIYPADAHPNAAASVRFADRIDAFLRESGLR